jgi:hypothetical protein
MLLQEEVCSLSTSHEVSERDVILRCLCTYCFCMVVHFKLYFHFSLCQDYNISRQMRSKLLPGLKSKTQFLVVADDSRDATQL